MGRFLCRFRRFALLRVTAIDILNILNIINSINSIKLSSERDPRVGAGLRGQRKGRGFPSVVDERPDGRAGL